MTGKSGLYSLLVNTSDGFEDCWDPFFTLLSKYWPKFNAPVFLNTERKNWSFRGMKVQCTATQAPSESTLPWSERLIRALGMVKTPLVLYFQEDYFLNQPVRDDIVRAAAGYMIAHPEVESISLTRQGARGPYVPHEESWLHGISQKARYRISTQAALWRVEALRSYLRSKENIWMFEIFGTWRAHGRNAVLLGTRFDEAHGGPAIHYLHTGIVKGRWLSGIQPEFEANGIKIDYSKRGFYVPKHPFLHKFDVGRKLLANPGLFAGAILRKLIPRQ